MGEPQSTQSHNERERARERESEREREREREGDWVRRAGSQDNAAGLRSITDGVVM